MNLWQRLNFFVKMKSKERHAHIKQIYQTRFLVKLRTCSFCVHFRTKTNKKVREFHEKFRGFGKFIGNRISFTDFIKKNLRIFKISKFIGYKQTNKQTDKLNLYIDKKLESIDP